MAAVILAYYHVWNAGYIWDDDMYVTRNGLLSAANGLRRIWFSFDAPSEYFPLTYTTLRIEHSLWGLDASGYHWTNILLHAANALLVWRLLRVLNVPAAWFGAALWALHPVQVESVAWISERKNVLMAFFFFATLLAWVRFVDGEKRNHSLGWFALALFFYLLALSAKTTACTLPAALVLILWWQGKPLTVRRWLQISPFVLAGIGAGIISVMWERIHAGSRPDFLPVGGIERVLIASRAIWFYLSKLVWPADLMFSYPHWNISRENVADYVPLVALVLLLGAIVYARRRLGRGPEVAFAFFVLTIGPLLGFFVVITFLYSFVADHYQYVACLGPLALFAAACETGMSRLPWPNKTWLARAGVVVVLALLAFLTAQQTRMYQNEETLWLRTIAQNPGSWMARNNLAGYWLEEKRFDDAIEQYRKIIELLPDNSLGHMNLGAALARKGDANGAIAEYERALAITPDDPRIERNLAESLVSLGRLDDAIAHFDRAIELRNARKGRVDERAELQLGLGNAWLQKGDPSAAITHYRSALELRPNFVAAHANLGSALLREGRRAEAIEQLRAAIALQPNEAAAHNNLGNALLEQGALEEAQKEFELAKRLNPGAEQSADDFSNLGNAAMQKRDFATAISNYRKALAIRANFPQAHSNLGMALLLQGNAADAIREFETTLTLAPKSVPTLNNLARLLATAPDAAIRDPDRAARLAQQAIELSGGRDAGSFGALAAALAVKGDFDAAEKAADQAIALATAANNAGYAEAIRREKETYRSGEAASGR